MVDIEPMDIHKGSFFKKPYCCYNFTLHINIYNQQSNF